MHGLTRAPAWCGAPRADRVKGDALNALLESDTPLCS